MQTTLETFLRGYVLHSGSKELRQGSTGGRIVFQGLCTGFIQGTGKLSGDAAIAPTYTPDKARESSSWWEGSTWLEILWDDHAATIHRAAVEAGIDEYVLASIYLFEGGNGLMAYDNIPWFLQTPMDGANNWLDRDGKTRRVAFGMYQAGFDIAQDAAAGALDGVSFDDLTGSMDLSARAMAWYLQGLYADIADLTKESGGLVVQGNWPASAQGVPVLDINVMASGTVLAGSTFVAMVQNAGAGVPIPPDVQVGVDRGMDVVGTADAMREFVGGHAG
jgi:hypothetical protein